MLLQINIHKEECILPGRKVQTARSGHFRDNAGANSSCNHKQHAAKTISFNNYSGQKATKMKPKQLTSSQFPNIQRQALGQLKFSKQSRLCAMHPTETASN